MDEVEEDQIDLTKLLDFLQCPECGGDLFQSTNNKIVCSNCEDFYPIIDGCPVLLRLSNKVFSTSSYKHAERLGKGKRSKPVSLLKKIVPTASVNLSSRRVLSMMNERLSNRSCSAKPRVLVVGAGTQRQELLKLLDPQEQFDILFSDIDIHADMDLVCDAHDLPFKTSSFDAVITTAVLEHVLYPEIVSAEIERVLQPGGLLYSELPFMQQVHEGAYDFTRFTLSGHRRLFKHIREFDSGLVAGPGTGLVWSIEHFCLVFISNKKLRLMMKFVIRLLFGWIKYSDYLLKNNPAAFDAASCTFLYGEKMSYALSDSELVDSYKGAQSLRHN